MRGLTLIETIIASCLLGLVILGVFTLLPSSLIAVRSGEHRLRADSLAQEWLETLRERPFEKLTLGPLAPQPPAQDWAGVTFQTSVEVYQLTAADVNLLKRIRVTVGWKFRGLARQLSQETYRVHVRRP